MTNALPVVRSVVLGVVLTLSFAVLGICAHINFLTANGYGYYYYGVFTDLVWTESGSMGIAVSVITIVSLIALIAVDLLRSGAFTSMVIVELVWLSVLWVLWLSAASVIASWCGTGLCSDYSRGAEALCFLIWIILLGYTVTLLTFAIIGSKQGKKAWTSSVKDLQTPATGTDTDAESPKSQTLQYAHTGQTLPVHPQPGYPPQPIHPQSVPPQFVPPQSTSPVLTQNSTTSPAHTSFTYRAEV